ncbi:GIY-YIG nuclease family protein [Methylomonas rivi]|uniref:GIY-YIG nuclease family protein n=1 Tax=Methylomonas rivi TaxID=2952226 RepID=A0ABT1UA56_9GAMM|nr:GIY-YIG nuclease family protein [Methylomonas sp. WSC-6]MCQ8130249.1 GIY-YIG nuclease family protein [Methylomonas sp. WSC-6]
MLTLADLFQYYGLKPEKIKLVRHGTEKTRQKKNVQLSILEIFQTDLEKFCYYQSFQQPKKFSKAEHIASFARTRGTTALFLGVWDIKGKLPPTEFNEQLLSRFREFQTEFDWTEEMVWYDLQRNPTMNELSQRLVIDWGKGTLAWVQNGSTIKNILEIKPQNPIGQFKSYDEILLSYQDLKLLIKEDAANSDWLARLSAVKGVYLIRDRLSGKLYVGSAYGDKGIYGRWAEYAKYGHGNNQQLIKLDCNHFEFSILETLPFGFDDEDVIAREKRWKDRLGTRQFGLNGN